VQVIRLKLWIWVDGAVKADGRYEVGTFAREGDFPLDGVWCEVCTG
jgi:hypothetical protein